jgi:hypothetical protein
MAVATSRPRGTGASRTTVLVVVVGLAVTAALAVAAWSAHDSNEDRLLRQRVREGGATLTAALPGIQTPLASAVELVELTDADPTTFRRAMTPLVGEEAQFVSASVWRLDGDDLAPLVVVGDEPALAAQPPEEIRAFLDRSAATPLLAVIDLLDHDPPRLGWSFTSPQDPTYMAYAEGALPENRTAVPQEDSAFNDLEYALYLGEEVRDESLLLASTPELPLDGRTAVAPVAFGDSTLMLVMTPEGELGGALMAWLPWLVALAGVLMTGSSALLTSRLVRRRGQAEALAAENSRLYQEQHSVAHTLQQSLLPDRLPDVAGMEVAVRYEPGVAGLEVGGDWYDVVAVGPDRLFVVIGDVAGRGVNAATTMASLRYAIRAFASQGDPPEVILEKLNAVNGVAVDGRFATVLCATVDLTTGAITMANAGHPSPLLLDRAGSRFVETPVGVPIGVMPSARYSSVTVPVAGGTTLLAFTDGLFERRGETVDVGMERLRMAAVGADGSLPGLLDGVVDDLSEEGRADDAALLGLRWL